MVKRHKDVYVKSNLEKAYIRREKNEYTSIIPYGCSINETLVLNKVGYEILEAAKEGCTIEKIISELIKRHHDANYSMVENDVFNYLGILFKLNLVTIKEGNEMYSGSIVMETSKYRLYRCAEGDFRILNEVLNKNEKNEIFDIKNVGEVGNSYVAINLRAKLFNYAEDFYMVQDDGEICAIVSIINGRNNYIKTSVIGLLKVYKKIPIKQLKKCFEAAFENHINFYNKESSKIRLSSTLLELQECGGLERFISEIGFEKICVLKDEIGKGNDLYLYDYYVG